MVDPQGDVSLGGIPGGPLFAPNDLLSLTILEAPDDLAFVFAMADVLQIGAPASWQIPIHWMDDAFLLRIEANTVYPVWLDVLDPSGIPERTHRLDDAEVYQSNKSILARVSKELLADFQGASPSVGDTLMVGPVRTWPYTNSERGPGELPNDVMPDNEEPQPYVLQAGGYAIDGLLLEAVPGGRFSNGEATIHSYTLHIVNPKPTEGRLSLEASALRPGWDVVLGQRNVVVAAGGNFEVAAWVLVPFGHIHEGVTEARLTAKSEAQTIDVPLVVRYPEIPQPTGHHNTLWAHGLPEDLLSGEQQIGAEGFWSTLPDDERSTGQPMLPSDGGLSGTTHHAGWQFRLSPKLLLDLDVMRPRPGHAELFFRTDVPLSSVVVSMDAWVSDDSIPDSSGASRRLDIVEMAPIEVGSMQAGQDIVVSGDITRVTNKLAETCPGCNLWLEVNLETTPYPVAEDLIGIYLLPGSFVELPLREVAYSVKTGDAGPLTWTSTIATNPGTRQQVSLRLEGDRSQDYAVRVVGPNSEWVTNMPVKSRGQSTITGTLEIPGNEPNGSPIVFAVVAEPERLDERTGFAAFQDYVNGPRQAAANGETVRSDPSEQPSPSKKSLPTVGLVPLIIVAVAIAWGRSSGAR